MCLSFNDDIISNNISISLCYILMIDRLAAVRMFSNNNVWQNGLDQGFGT